MLAAKLGWGGASRDLSSSCDSITHLLCDPAFCEGLEDSLHGHGGGGGVGGGDREEGGEVAGGEGKW